MFLEDVIKGKDKFHEVKIEGFDNYFECRELTRREEKELNKILYQGVDKIDLGEIQRQSGKDDNDVELPIKVDMSQFNMNQSDSGIYLVKTAFKFAKTKKDKTLPIDDKILEYLTDEQIQLFVNAYNEIFDKEDLNSFPEGQEES